MRARKGMHPDCRGGGEELGVVKGEGSVFKIRL